MNNRQCFFTILLAISLFILSGSTSLLAQQLPDNNVSDTLLGIVRDKIEGEYSVLVSGVLPLPRSALMGETLVQQDNEHIRSLLNTYSVLSFEGQQYISYSVSLKVKSLDISSSTAVIKVREKTILNLSSSGEIIETREKKLHKVRFELKDGQWKIVSFKELQGLGSVLGDGTPIPQTVLDDVDSSITAELRINQLESLPVEERGTTYYRGTSAAYYAIKYAYSPNTNYRYYKDNDCTNFISQALAYGGWVQLGGWYSDVTKWWYRKDRQVLWGYRANSTSWVNAQSLYWFIRKSNRALQAKYDSQLIVGDVVQIDFNNDNIMDHTMIVTKRDSYGKVYMSYHTSNTRNKALSQIRAETKAKYPNARFFGHLLLYKYIF